MEKKDLERSRLFGAAVEKVRNPEPPKSRNVRSIRMRSDAAILQQQSSHRAIMKVGGRAGSRKVLAISNPKLAASLHGAIRKPRFAYRDAGLGQQPYDRTTTAALSDRRLSSPSSSRRLVVGEKKREDERWTHDLYDGDVSANPGSVAFLRNLPASITQQQLVKLFSTVGDIASVKIDLGPLTTARIAFVKRSSASEAAKRFHGHKVHSRAIKVSEFISLDAQDRERRESSAAAGADNYEGAMVDEEDNNEEYDEDEDMGLPSSSSCKLPRVFSSLSQRPATRHRHPSHRSVLMSDAPQKSVFDRLL